MAVLPPLYPKNTMLSKCRSGTLKAESVVLRLDSLQNFPCISFKLANLLPRHIESQIQSSAKIDNGRAGKEPKRRAEPLSRRNKSLKEGYSEVLSFMKTVKIKYLPLFKCIAQGKTTFDKEDLYEYLRAKTFRKKKYFMLEPWKDEDSLLEHDCHQLLSSTDIGFELLDVRNIGVSGENEFLAVCSIAEAHKIEFKLMSREKMLLIKHEVKDVKELHRRCKCTEISEILLKKNEKWAEGLRNLLRKAKEDLCVFMKTIHFFRYCI